ncbi:FAD-dependent oxidoreductase [Mesorhizobium atlanticum]
MLFHLARHGWTDVVLLERDELTSGSTWHAAGGMHTINGDPNVAKLQKYTISLYKEIEELSGQATGVHLTGGVLLAATEATNGLGCAAWCRRAAISASTSR